MKCALSFPGSGLCTWLSDGQCPPLHLTPTQHSPQGSKPPCSVLSSLVTSGSRLVPNSHFVKEETDTPKSPRSRIGPQRTEGKNSDLETPLELGLLLSPGTLLFSIFTGWCFSPLQLFKLLLGDWYRVMVLWDPSQDRWQRSLPSIGPPIKICQGL